MTPLIGYAVDMIGRSEATECAAPQSTVQVHARGMQISLAVLCCVARQATTTIHHKVDILLKES